MIQNQGPIVKDARRLQQIKETLWAELCERHLPVVHPGSIWRHNREILPSDPAQGWKLHIAATLPNACWVLQTVAPLLRRRGVLWKAPVSLDEVAKLNAGIYYGYSQVGKFLTIYPRDTAEALLLARRLHEPTRKMSAPTIPFDLKYRADGCVYYRYGAFKRLAVGADAKSESAICNPEGNLIVDKRDSLIGKPDWVDDPFITRRSRQPKRDSNSQLRTTFKVFRAMAQRGKGGVYQAIDLSVMPPRLCILKEGRKDGEVDWQGRDGFWRANHEVVVLRALNGAGVGAPAVYSSFKAEKNYYIAAEFIDGEDLEKWLHRKKRRLAISAAMKLGIEIADLVSRIHSAGWVWRDCKPRNIIRSIDRRLRPIDFEGACPVNQPDQFPFGTTTYIAPETHDQFHGQSRLPEDLYALGVTLFILFTGRPPDIAIPGPERLRRNLPKAVGRLIGQLMHADPKRRPNAQSAVRRLKTALKDLKNKRSR